MPNQQLRDYIAAQLRLGVTKEAIRAALVASGWAEADVNVSMNEAAAGPSPASPAPRGTPSPAAPTNDAFQTKREPMFNPRAVAQKKEEGPAARGIPWRPVLFGAASVAALAVLAGAGMLFRSRLELQRNIEALDLRNAELNERITALNATNEELNAQATMLINDAKDLELQLSFFAVPSDGSTSTAVQAVPITIAGRLTLSTSADQYVLTTNRDVRLFVGSSKDPKVDAVLRPYIRSMIEVSGTHLPGERLIMVTHVNGLPVQ